MPVLLPLIFLIGSQVLNVKVVWLSVVIWAFGVDGKIITRVYRTASLYQKFASHDYNPRREMNEKR